MKKKIPKERQDIENSNVSPTQKISNKFLPEQQCSRLAEL